ncbi:MAG: hypothetical protein ABWW65_07870 [Thermoprotei archaeon]
MKKLVLAILLTVVITALSIALLIYWIPSSSTSNELIELETYSGWKGVENMITPLDEYEKTVKGDAISFSDLLWPHADSQNPFENLVDRGVGVAIVTITSVEAVYRYQDVFAYVVYSARIDKVIVKPSNTIAIPPESVCIKDPEFCELAKNQSRVIDNLLSMIRENNTVELLVRAFIAKDSINKTNLTISDIASPFPLLEPGYQYLVFLKPDLDGIHIYYDFVWGPWVYLILEGRVYSLNYVKPPANVSLDPTKLFKSPYIRWKPYPYEKLREIALEKLSIYGEKLENFISKITKSS